MIGKTFGPYQILAELGRGGMGEVYRAKDTKLNRDVAIKVLPELFAADPERLARFIREAQTLAALNHPNIAHIHGLEESQGVRALVMELVEGEDLSAHIARGPMPLSAVLPIAKQIADALEAAHEAGIIHRDLKPANIKIRADGTVKVLDFGLAKAMAPQGASGFGTGDPGNRGVHGAGTGENEKLKKVPAVGGTVEVLCEARDGRGGSWGTANVIVFSPSSAGALQSVSANGGDPKAATTLDAARGETGHRCPSFLPDGRHFLFASLPQKNQKFDLYVGSTDGSAPKPVTAAEGAAVYAEPGYILFSRKNVLVAQRFDPDSLQLSDEPVTIGDAPSSMGAQWASGRAVSVSTTGALACLGDRLPSTRLAWFDRSGREAGTLSVPEGRYQEISFSPDGGRAALMRLTSPIASDLWLADISRGGATRFTSAPGLNQMARWSPEGNRIAFASDRGGARDFYIKPSSAAQPEAVLYASISQFKDLGGWSPDSRAIAFSQLDAETNRDLWILPVEPAEGRTPTVYLRTPFNEHGPEVSPDGRWLAYLSDESGRVEVYVDAFPVPRHKYRVTDNGGFSAHWQKGGRELALVSADLRSVLVADVTSGADIRVSAPRQLFSLPRGTIWAQPTPDLQRFLVAVPVAENTTSTLTVVFDWLGALQKK